MFDFGQHYSCFRFTIIEKKEVFLPTAKEGNIFTGVCLSTIGLMDIGSLLGLVTAQSVLTLLECFLVNFEVFCHLVYLHSQLNRP